MLVTTSTSVVASDIPGGKSKRERERKREYIRLAFNRACRGCKRAIFVVVFVRTVLNVHITEPFSIFLLGVMYGRIYDLC